MNAPEKLFLPDIQATIDHRRLAIDQVGVKGIRHPLTVRTASGDSLPTVATINMYVGLPQHVKGTHMSRFLELLQEHGAPLDYASLRQLVLDMCMRLDATSGIVEIHCPYFVKKKAPVSGVESLLDYDVRWRGELKDGEFRCSLAVTAPVTSLCPCSREISAYGAHNQRSHIGITAEVNDAISIESLVGVAEQEASCEVFGLLKRPDEKWVTERAYDNPKFVEDLVRDIALRLDTDPRVLAYVVESENFESIHNHSAYARLVKSR